LGGDGVDLPPPDTARLNAALETFSRLRPPGEDAFLDAKETPFVRAERVRSYLLVRPGLTGAQRVLDWGCRHGASAQLVRADLGDAVDLHGADFSDPQQYAAFHALSKMQYLQLRHPRTIEFPEAHFDAVIGAGVLEHVANIDASLNELWRVLRVDGALLLTHLPNALSWSEWLSRRAAPEMAHARRFRPSALRQTLLDHGFATERWGYHHFPPTMLPARSEDVAVLRGAIRAAQPLRVVERVWPLRVFSAAIWVIARKKWGF
jgi:2-polyprenyl-3-methyl-5-hydroxy-6-metoxy-1,4-benzoquinol methylase